jgi:hypothetical protein
MSRSFLPLGAFVVLLAACGEPLLNADEVPGESVSTSTTEQSLEATTMTTPPEGVNELDPQLEAALDELDRLWTSECEATVEHAAKRVVEDVVDWKPTFVQSVGDFGGDLGTLRADLQLNEACPFEGYAVRFLTLTDQLIPHGEMSLLLGVAPFVESSVQAISWSGPVVAMRLSPEVDPAAPDPPDWPSEFPADCDALGSQIGNYFGRLIESANGLSPLDEWESLGSAAAFDGAMLEDTGCPIDDLLVDMLDGLAEAETKSFVAILLRWQTVIGIREWIRPTVIGESPVSMDSDVSNDEYRLVLTNHGETAVQSILVEVWEETDDPYHWLEPPDFEWSYDILEAGEEVTVVTDLPAGTTIQTMTSWTERDGITRRNEFNVGAFEPIGESVP